MTRRAALTRFSFIAAPVLLIAYGCIRLFAVGSRAPGWAWTTGHAAFLLGVVLFGVACTGLHRIAAADGGPARRRFARGGLVAGLVGTGAAFTQAAVDLYVGLRAADKPEMRELFAQVQDIPGVMPLVYTVGPLFLYVGLITLLASLTGRDALRSLLLVVVGTVAIGSDLDFLPVGGLCYLLAFAPLTRRVTAVLDPGPASTRPQAA
ncbi:hypothetical protein ACFWUQ_18175 [Streptomyces sp. NPDC058662]|uniref:hypothetical protein n=1 Tax=Streptomyces sp. NPDC058662 TaxID=3346583 RepID=UPI00365EE18D